MRSKAKVFSVGPIERIAFLCALGIASLLAAAPAAAVSLPDNRAYEMVSPPQKKGGNVEDFDVKVAPSGDKVSYGSRVAFADAKGSNLFVTYIATRTDSGWFTHAPLPPFLNVGSIAELGAVASLSPDLTRATVSMPEMEDPNAPPPLDSNAPLGPLDCAPNIFCRNDYLVDLAAPTYGLLTPVPPASGSASHVTYAGGSSDYSRLFFESHAEMAGNNRETELREGRTRQRPGAHGTRRGIE